MVLLVALPLSAGCNSSSGPEPTERWATTEDTTVKIDWDKINEAYKLAEGPEDLEKRINEIYEGNEVISVSVADEGANAQVVTGFFDKNTNGAVEDGEKVFTIRREMTSETEGRYQTMGYGPYYGYHSPFLGIASGMMLGSMMSRAFMPGYAPMYTQPYTTSPARAGSIAQSRSAYRAANPSKFQNSKSGRTYNRTTPTKAPSAPGGVRGGGRFGATTKGRAVRLDA